MMNELTNRSTTNLVNASSVSAVVDEQMIVAIELKLIETKHETLEDRFRLESDEAIQIVFVLRP